MFLSKNLNRLVILVVLLATISVGALIAYSQGEQKFQISSLQKGLIAYWPLDGVNYNPSSTRVSDKGPYENHGINYGAMLTPGRSGESSTAMKFGNTANQEYISAPISPVAYNLSMSAWINPTSYPSERATILVNSSAYYLSLSSDGSVQTYWYGRTPAGYHSSGAGVVPLNKWTHVAAVWSESNVKIYVNGILRNTVTVANEPGTNPSTVIIGAQNTARQFKGSIADVYMHNRSLSSEEVKSLFESSKSKISFSSSQRGLIFDAPLSSRYIKEETSGAETLSNRASYEGSVLNNGAILGPDGANFNGSSWISLPYGAGVNPSTNPISFSMWVKANNPNSDMIFLSAGGSPNPDSRFYLGTYNGKWDMGIATSGWGSGTNVADNNWTHIALVMDGAKANLYVNGQPSINKSYSSYEFNQNFEIGRHVGGTYYWSGEISDLSIYNRMLSASEVSLIYEKNRKNQGTNISVPSTELVRLDYLAGPGGSILGNTVQFLEPGASGALVTAHPNSGYVFINWSDGSTQNPRTDTNITENKSVTANFVVDPCGGQTSVTFDYNGSQVIYDTVVSAGKCWLDRNLGASRVCTSVSDPQCYGDLFQWGRLADGHQLRNSLTISSLSPNDVPGHSYFIIDSDPYNGYRNPHNSNLWQGVTGINNPCPPGWRVPTSSELETEMINWESNNNAGAFGSVLKWSAGGYRAGTNGVVYQANTNVRAWSSDIYFSRALGYVLSDSSAVVTSFYRSVGASVRCVRDDFSNNYYRLTYVSGSNGSIDGHTSQTVISGGNGVAVTATPNTGYSFINWSDGSTQNPRTDTNVTSNITVTANFLANCSTPCGSINHGATCTMYESASVGCDGNCSAFSTTCDNGILSAEIPSNYTETSCTVNTCGTGFMCVSDECVPKPWECGDDFIATGGPYGTANINGVCWFTKNLNISDDARTPSWCYDLNEANCDIYGRLYYNRNETNHVGSFCPSGTHLATGYEFATLGSSYTFWRDSAFAVKLGGYGADRVAPHNFQGLGTNTQLWQSYPPYDARTYGCNWTWASHCRGVTVTTSSITFEASKWNGSLGYARCVVD